MLKDAVLDQSRKYRYVLKRQWGGNANNFVNFVLLNPSTADETKDDRTITACIKLAQNLGYDGLWVTNLFAFRATDPTDFKKATEPIGEQNNQYLEDYAKRSKIVVIAWGNHGDFLNRDQEVIKMLSEIQAPHCLEITKLGSPKHPLYIKRTAKPFPFRAAHPTHGLAGPRAKTNKQNMKFIKKGVQAYDGGKVEVIEFLNLKTMVDFFKSIKSYIDINIGTYGKDYKSVIYARPRGKITDSNDLKKPSYQIANIEWLDNTESQLYFEIPDIPWE